MGKIKFSYCNVCEKEVEPSKKSLDSMQKTVWAIIFVCTLGFGVILYLFYTNYVRKKIYCPKCDTKLVFSETPFERPKTLAEMTTKEQIMAKTGKKIMKKEIPEEEEVEGEEDEEKIFCPFCGQQLKEKIATCPYCKTAIKY